VDGKDRLGTLYDRAKLRAGNIIRGPAIVLEMDATTVILPGHVGKVDKLGNILITPEA
jgi:N-methylhydantoinase A